MKNDLNQTAANFPPLTERPEPPSLADWAYRPLPGEAVEIAFCVVCESTPDDPFARQRADDVRAILEASGFRCRDLRLSIPLRQVPSASELERRRRLHARAADLAKRSKESRELADQLLRKLADQLLRKHGLRRD